MTYSHTLLSRSTVLLASLVPEVITVDSLIRARSIQAHAYSGERLIKYQIVSMASSSFHVQRHSWLAKNSHHENWETVGLVEWRP